MFSKSTESVSQERGNFKFGKVFTAETISCLSTLYLISSPPKLISLFQGHGESY